MKKSMKRLSALLMACLTAALLMSAFACPALAEEAQAAADTGMTTSAKALSSAIAIGLAAGLGALAMGMAISKSAEAISRQPEAAGNIRTALMLGLVFVETAIIYALIVAILVIFVL